MPSDADESLSTTPSRQRKRDKKEQKPAHKCASGALPDVKQSLPKPVTTNATVADRKQAMILPARRRLQETYRVRLLDACGKRTPDDYATFSLPFPWRTCVRTLRNARAAAVSGIFARVNCVRQCYVPYYQLGRIDQMLEHLFRITLFMYNDE